MVAQKLRVVGFSLPGGHFRGFSAGEMKELKIKRFWLLSIKGVYKAKGPLSRWRCSMAGNQLPVVKHFRSETLAYRWSGVTRLCRNTPDR